MTAPPLRPDQQVFLPTPQSAVAGPGIYTDGGEILLLTVQTRVAGFTIGVRLRVITPDGELHAILYPFVTAGTGAVEQAIFSLPPGWVTSALIIRDGGSAQQGECYARLILRRGRSGANQALLCQGYVSDDSYVHWPLVHSRSSVDGVGAIVRVTSADPAAGAEISQTVPAGQTWELLAMRFQLVNDATVAVRNVGILFDDGATAFLVSKSASAQTASQSHNYNVGAFGVSPVVVVNEHIIPVPRCIRLRPGYRIRTNTDNLQAGDNFGAAQLVVQVWMGAT